MSVFRNNIRWVFTNPVKVFIIVVLPIIFVFIFLYGEDDNVPIRVLIFDDDNTELSRGLVNEIDASAKIVESDRELILDTLVGCLADYAVVIPQGYTDSLLSGEDVLIEEYYFIGEEKLFSLRNSISTYINSARGLYAAAQNDAEFYSMLSEINDHSVKFQYEIKEKRSAMETVQALGFLVQFIMYSTILIVASIVVDKESNITPRILSSPMPLNKYLGAHLLSFVVMEIVVSLVLMSTLKVIFGYSFYGYFGTVLLMLILFAVSVTALSVMVLSICRKSKLFYWVMICITTPLVMLGGCYFEVSSFPEIVQNIARFIPTTWIMNVSRDVLVDGNLDSVGITSIVFAAFIVFFLSVSRIGLKELLRAK